MSQEIFQRLAQVVIDGEPEEAEELARQALDLGLEQWAISLAHTDTHAIGMAVATGRSA